MKDKSEKRMAAGCFVVAAIFFMILAIYQCTAERQAKQNVRQSAPLPSRPDTIRHKTKTVIGIPIPTDDEETDNDLYDNPDFDDLIPGDEYDEEFVDRDEGDPELYE